MKNEIMSDLAITAIARQKAQLDLVLQLVEDDDAAAITLSMLCLCGAIGETAARVARSYNDHNPHHKKLDQGDAVLIVLRKIEAMLKRTAP